MNVKYRSIRLAASNHGEAYKFKKGDPTNRVRKFLNPPNLETKAMKHGKLMEPKAREQYNNIYSY